MTVIDVLRGARALVVRGWTKGAKARNKHGESIGPLSPDAVCHCADGGLLCAAGGDTPVYRDALKVLSGVVAGGTAPEFNDLPETTKDDVVAAYGRAIEQASR